MLRGILCVVRINRSWMEIDDNVWFCDEMMDFEIDDSTRKCDVRGPIIEIGA